MPPLLTLIIIAANQEIQLKQNLQSIEKTFKDYADIILIDDGSTDHTKEYIQTHFTNIRYIRNNCESGYQHCFNSIISTIPTPYFSVCDPHINISSLHIPNIIEQLQQNSAFIATIPIQINRQLHHGFSCIYHAKQLELMSFKHPTPLCHFSELMIIDTKRFTIFQQLDERFYTAGFAWYDLVFQASKQSQKIITYKNSSCHKHTQENACFSYLINNKTSLKDSILFQWKNITSKRLKLNLFIWTLASCLAFKPLRLRLLMETWFKKCWSKQTQKTHWHVYKDTDILLNKYMYQKLISSS